MVLGYGGFEEAEIRRAVGELGKVLAELKGSASTMHD
jgi:hypothetical protein